MKEQKYLKSQWGTVLKARADDVRADMLEMVEIIGVHAKALAKSGNIAIAYYEIDGKNGYLYSHSQVNYLTHPIAEYNLFVLVKDNRKFSTLIVDSDGTIGEGFNRFTDSEAKILEEIASTFSNGSSGSIELFTDNQTCSSCEYVIEQFEEMYPNIHINVYYEKSITKHNR
ncbi:deaminase domain-containing protein [Paenibacillus sp. DMB5]|uniref:deaminase domain-containing protein n=1 Tax=Paenibacillus sp. DMB5 TaxID=1780103 RepID=UPI00076D535A|nr:deaminase domain-containing protein [Paenibacillus sp. DMB5]KUP25785.1 hypothetical protein AWJ19_19365 [Paenibacillus sp. DMB5]